MFRLVFNIDTIHAITMSTSTSIFIGSSTSAANKLTLLKFLIILIIIFGILLYIIDFSSLRLSQFKFHLTLLGDEDMKWSWNFIDEYDARNRLAHKSYFVNTNGCRMPSFNVLDNNVEKFLFNVKPVVCRKALTKSNNNFIWIDLNETEVQNVYNVNDVDEIQCAYEPFIRDDDFTNKFPETNAKQYFRFGDIVKVTDEFIRVICRNKRKKEIYRNYHYFVPNKRNAEDTVNKDKTTKKQMNVMVIGLDSISRLNFHRRMNESVGVLLNELRAIELFGYNKVADNTYPNLIPALTGLDENELVSACIPNKNETFDRCHFIWDDYKAKNYTTAYVEDMASLGLFQYLRRGFAKQPTDYNIRPIIIEMERYVATLKNGNTHLCLGGRRTFDVLLDYAEKFVSSIIGRLDQPFFSFFWTTSYTHDYLNFPTIIDSNLAQFLRNLSTSKALDNTFLILMSDHGIRWGSFRNTYQGMMEERQPFLFLVPPSKFPRKYPSAMRNLVRNRHRLTTHFDLYETLRDLIELDTLTPTAIKQRTIELAETEPMPRGISLFLPIPSSRTCYDSDIAPHWCTCHEKSELSTTDSRVERVARMMVETLNRMIKNYPECQRLYLNSISDANIGTSNTVIRNVTNHFVDITVRLQTKPGLGEFEATVRVHEHQDLELTGTISRTNLYGKQSQCIDDYKLKLYCFCDSLM